MSNGGDPKCGSAVMRELAPAPGVVILHIPVLRGAFDNVLALTKTGRLS